jgi:acyl-CoA reductase-like NAD-dependent aldehyde dehydrogenase
MTTVVCSWIAGRDAGATDPAFDFRAPQTDGVAFAIAEASAATIDAAVREAHAAFTAMRKTSTATRIGWLEAAATKLAAEADRVAELICVDVGKPLRVAKFEVNRGVQFLRACASALQHFSGEVVPVDAAALGAGHYGFTRHVPYGVVAGITPFNAPVNLLVQKVGPALAAGNAVVVKPHPAGVRTARAVAQIMLASGLPAGLFSVVSGDRLAAAALVRHPLVRAVTFTGGTAGGEALMREAGPKKFLSELGSNAANVVLADADLADAARKIAGAAFEASGQQCISAQRVIVEQGAYATFLPLFVEAARALRVGTAREDTTDVGPMVSMQAADRVMAMCADAITRGARYALEPRRDRCIVSPAILVDVPRDAQLWTDEVFGPVALVTAVPDIDAALTAANDSPFGLQGAVFTRSLAAAFRFSEDFEVGSLWVNEASRFRLDMYPFGGMKQSGLGREGVRYAIEEMTQLRFTGIRP